MCKQHQILKQVQDDTLAFRKTRWRSGRHVGVQEDTLAFRKTNTPVMLNLVQHLWLSVQNFMCKQHQILKQVQEDTLAFRKTNTPVMLNLVQHLWLSVQNFMCKQHQILKQVQDDTLAFRKTRWRSGRHTPLSC
ncbi:MAG: hypothetical protein HGGPFJEG_01366 [Ignavibacteria bacterium]|nr:hypothetical protein [Ignavibacteria bacterium]